MVLQMLDYVGQLIWLSVGAEVHPYTRGLSSMCVFAAYVHFLGTIVWSWDHAHFVPAPTLIPTEPHILELKRMVLSSTVTAW